MKVRIISAVVALGIIIPLLFIQGIPLMIGIGFISILAYKEITDLKPGSKKLPTVVKIIGIIALLMLVFMSFDGYSFAFGLSYKSVALSILMLTIPTIFLKDEYTSKDALNLLGFILLLGMFFNNLILIVDYNIKYLIFLILIAVVTDTFAMLIGVLIGKNKLIPEVSPKKSWEGAIGGSIVCVIVASAFYINIINSDVVLWKIGIIVLWLSIIGQLGDLFFSKIKRENGIKDFSNLMPGHGGILDRLDSIIFIVLAFSVIFSMI